MKPIVDQFKKETNLLFSTLGFRTALEKIIGLDIGHKTFRAVRISRIGKNFCIKKDLIKNINSLKDLNKDFGIQPDEKVSINFHGDNIAIRQVSIPVMPKEEIEAALKWQLKDNIQFDIDTAKIRFDILSERDGQGGAKKIDVLAIIYREGEIEKKVEELRGFGLNVFSVFPSEFALTGYAKHLNIISSQDKTAIVDIGSKRTNIAIIENERLRFSRDLNIGGDDITEAMTGILVSDKGRVELSREEAEKIKCEQGIPIDDTGILSLMRPVLEKLAGQIKKSLDYYESIFQRSVIEKIILAGNGAKLKGLRDFMSKETGLDVLHILPEAACAAGLSLISGSDLNIIPERFAIEKKTLLKKVSFRIIFILIALLFLLSYGFLSARAVYLKNEVSVVRQHWENIKDVAPVKERIVELANAINDIHRETLNAGNIMKELSRIVPAYARLDDLSMRKNKPNIKISGFILKGDRLTEFMDSIERSSLFENVKLKFSKKVEPYSMNALQFELVFDIRE